MLKWQNGESGLGGRGIGKTEQLETGRRAKAIKSQNGKTATPVKTGRWRRGADFAQGEPTLMAWGLKNPRLGYTM